MRRAYPGELLFQLLALVSAVVIVHATYVTLVRPRADAALAEQAAALESDPDAVQQRSVWVIVRDFEQEACFILMLWAMAIVASKWWATTRESRMLDLLALGEEPARFLGADVEPLKRRLYLASSLLTAAAVAVSGIIGFVGLVVPHAVRMLWGSTHGALLPSAFLLGGSLLVGADALARTVVAPLTLPVGVVTAIIGVPVFAVLVRRWAS